MVTTAIGPNLGKVVPSRRLKNLSYVIEPFDLFLYSDEEGLCRLRSA